MAINVAGLKVLNADKLRTGFRAKHNLTIDKLVVDMKIVGVDQNILRLTTHDNTNIDLDLSSYFYTKDDIDDLFLVPLATETKAGRIRIGTLEEVEEGFNDSVAVTPYKLHQLLMYFNGGGFIAGEDLDPGDFVYIYQDEITGDLMMKKAIATSLETLCDGYTIDEVLEGEEGVMKFSGGKNDQQALLVPHAWYYLSPKVPDPWEEDPDPMDEDYNPLQITRYPPSEVGEYRQIVGYAVSTTELMVELHPGEVILGDVFEDLPALVFVKDVEMTASLSLEDYLIEGIDPESLSFRFVGVPDWITDTMVVFNYLSFIGTGIEVGETVVQMEVSSGTAKQFVPLLLKVIEPPKVVFRSTPGGIITPGQVKQLPYDPNYSLAADIYGPHDGYAYSFLGGGVDVDDGFQEGEAGTLSIISDEPLSEGLMTSTVKLYLKTGYDGVLGEDIYTEVVSKTINYVLGESLGETDPDHIIRAYLSPYVAQLSSEVSVFQYESGGIDLFFISNGVLFDKLKLTLFPNEAPFYQEVSPVRTPVSTTYSNLKIDPLTGVPEADPNWRATSSIAVSVDDIIWSDGLMMLYNDTTFVRTVSNGTALIVDGTVNSVRANKMTTDPFVEKITPPILFMFDGLVEKGVGEFSLMLVAEDGGVDVYQRLVKWVVSEKDPDPIEPVGGLKLLQMSPSQVLATMGITGTVVELPPSGFNVLCPDFDGQEVDEIYWTYEVDRGGWQEVDIERFTGRAPVRLFETPTATINQLAFWNKGSEDIGTIHSAPLRHRTTFYGKLDGVLVAVKQADFFITDEPIGPPSGMSLGYIDYGGESILIQQSNVPDSGGYYPILKENVEAGMPWVIYTNTLDGSTLFDGARVKLDGTIVGTYSDITPKSTIDAMPSTYLTWGDIVSGHREVAGVNIDLPGTYTVVYEFLSGVTVIGTKTATITLYDEEPEIKDPTECCGDKCEGGVIVVRDW